MPVQPHGDSAPFFYVAPYLITALSFANLGIALGDDQPLYVLQPQGLETDDPVHDSVEAMAAHYIDEIREVQPERALLDRWTLLRQPRRARDGAAARGRW